MLFLFRFVLLCELFTSEIPYNHLFQNFLPSSFHSLSVNYDRGEMWILLIFLYFSRVSPLSFLTFTSEKCVVFNFRFMFIFVCACALLKSQPEMKINKSSFENVKYRKYFSNKNSKFNENANVHCTNAPHHTHIQYTNIMKNLKMIMMLNGWNYY